MHLKSEHQGILEVFFNMPLSLPVLIGWLGHIIISYYFIRPLHHSLLRASLTFTLCFLLIMNTCRNLPTLYPLSMIILAICWLTLIHLTVFPGRNYLSFPTFLSKILWTLLPLRSGKSKGNQWPLVYQIVLLMVKVLLSQWMYRWLISCNTRTSYLRVLLFYGSFMTISFFLDAGAVLIRFMTHEKYSIESFTNLPVFSFSLREF
jgi:hypothetical protein